MGNQLKVGIIGCGEATQALHVPSLNSLASLYRITACSDAGEEVMSEVASRTGAKPVKNPFDLVKLSNVDVVLIATPDSYHLDHALAACAAKKKAVLVEKPLTLNSRMAREIAKTSEKTGVPVLVSYPHVYEPAVRKAMELWGGPQAFRYGQFRTFIGPNAKYTADDILQTIRPSVPDRWPAMINQLDYVAACSELLGTDVDINHIVAYGLLIGLVIHDIPVMRRLLGEPVKIDYAGAHLLGPPMGEFSLAMDIMLDYGMGRTLLQSEVQEIKMTDWSFQVRRADLLLDVTYPTTYAAAAPSSCTATYEKDGMTVEETHGGRYETGFRCEWKHIHDVVTSGAEPLTPAKEAIKDLELVEDIIQAMVRQSQQGGVT